MRSGPAEIHLILFPIEHFLAGPEGNPSPLSVGERLADEKAL